MLALTIAPNLDVMEGDGPCFDTGGKAAGKTFGLQCSKEAFHHSIVVTVTNAAHADLDIMVFQELLVHMTGILAALVGMIEQTGFWAPSLQRHTQRISDQVGHKVRVQLVSTDSLCNHPGYADAASISASVSPATPATNASTRVPVVARSPAQATQ